MRPMNANSLNDTEAASGKSKLHGNGAFIDQPRTHREGSGSINVHRVASGNLFRVFERSGAEDDCAISFPGLFVVCPVGPGGEHYAVAFELFLEGEVDSQVFHDGADAVYWPCGDDVQLTG